MKSNEVLLTVRQNLVSWFKKYEYILLPLLRFILSISVLRMLMGATEYEGAFSNSFVLLGFSIIGAFASAEAIIVCMILIATIFLVASNIVLGVMSFIFLAFIYIIYGHLFPKESILIILMLVAFPLKLEFAIPLIAALFGTYVSVGAIILGTIIWYTFPVLMQALPAMTFNKSEILEMVNKLVAIDYKGLLVNKEMLIMCVIFFIVFTCVYVIRKLGVDYAPYIAISIGAVMNIFGVVLAKVFFSDLELDILLVVLMTIIFSLVAALMQFFAIVLDYQRAEIVEFEDDDNFYHVKIIPKIQLAVKKKTVKHIYTNKEQTRVTPQMSERERINRMIMEEDEFKF